ncbi:MAG: NAD-dependent epimerase/dehydratase family protein [Rhodospirillales bacterium]|nr:NAD-dependent epimerase/dehydratase family protein [Rhodospirillales bacterium]
MKVLITGGAGFIGFRLAQKLIGRGRLTGPSGREQAIDEIVLFDVVEAAEIEHSNGIKITRIAGDISDRAAVMALVDRDDMSIFHLASVVSGGGEKDFDLAIRVNLDGAMNVFEAARARAGLQRVIMTSSIAVFGGPHMPGVVGDTVKQGPQTTYGVTKAIGELLINDYTRKGFFDGRCARLPTVIIRPGKPNAAASSFVSGVFREPLNGVDFKLPVPVDTVMQVVGYRAIVDGLVHLHETDGAALGTDRAIMLRGYTVSAQDMIDAVQRLAGQRTLGKITVEPDPFIVDICKTWPLDASYERAEALGFPCDSGLDEVIGYFIDDYVES